MQNLWQHPEMIKRMQQSDENKNNIQQKIDEMGFTKKLPSKILELKLNIELKDLPEVMELLSQIFDDLNKEDREEICRYVIEYGLFHGPEEIEEEIRFYQFFKNARQKTKKYISQYTLDDIIEALNTETMTLESIALYLLVKFCFDQKIKKEEYFKEDEIFQPIHKIIQGCFYSQKEMLLDIAMKMKEDEIKQYQEILKKKINKVLTKAETKRKAVMHKQSLTSLQRQAKIENLLNQTRTTLSQILEHNHFEYYPEIIEFINRCEISPENIENRIEETQPSLQEQNPDLIVVDQFYSSHHIYYKKSQIQEEIGSNPKLLEFYQFYDNINQNNDSETIISQLEELIADIRESSLKRTEAGKRLLTVSQKEIEEILDREPEIISPIEIEEIKEEPVIEENIENKSETIQIGKYTLLADSATPSPVNLNALIQLLAPESRHHIHLLEKLIFQIGYDKVHAYLLKAPLLYIEDLEAIIRLDRQLRFEYQRVLEDIEMYFRSSLTYYLSNKYDEKLLIADDSNKIFYKRSYLMRNLFIDPEEHYFQIGQLNERIDAEMKNNNQQIIKEYKEYKYALPFSTAAGIMTFGWVMTLFDNLNYQDKKEYLETYYLHITPPTFSNWMNSLTILRNRCAHYHSLYRISSLKELKPIMTKDVDSYTIDHEIKHSNLFYYTMIMTRLSPDIYNAQDFIDNIGILFRKANRENYTFNLSKDYSFPANWREILEKEASSRIPYLDD